MKTTSLSVRLLRLIVSFCWWACIVLMFVLTIVIAAAFFAKPKSMELSLDTYAHGIDTAGMTVTARNGARGNVSFDEPVKIELSIPAEDIDSSGLWLVGVFAFAMAGLVAILYFIKQFRGILGTVESGDPFVPENAIRMRIIGILVLVFGVFGQLAELVASALARRIFAVEGFSISSSFSLDLVSIVAGLSLLALSEVFRHGAMLREEQELTI